MGEFEDLAKFKENFDDSYENYVNYENPVIKQDELAWDFFDRLNSKRYASFIHEMNCAINILNTVKPESVILSDMLWLLQRLKN